MPSIRYWNSIKLDPNTLEKLYIESNGRIQELQSRLAKDEGIAIAYSTLTRKVRNLGIRLTRTNSMQNTNAAQQRLADVITTTPPTKLLAEKLKDPEHFSILIRYLPHLFEFSVF